MVAKVNSINTNGFVLKTKYQTVKTELEKKIPNVSNLVKKAKHTKLENKIPNVSSLVTKTAFTAVENKITDVSSLVKKTNYNTKITEIEKKVTDHNHDKCITTPESNKFAREVFNERLKQANLVTKKNFDEKLRSLSQKNDSNQIKQSFYLLKMNQKITNI